MSEGLSQRPRREGVWFVAHHSILPEIEFEASIDVYEEFLSKQPDRDERAQGFMMIKLSPAQARQTTHASE